jgi:hypothetical protein
MKYYNTEIVHIPLSGNNSDAMESGSVMTLGSDALSFNGGASDYVLMRFDLTPAQAVAISGKRVLPESHLIFNIDDRTPSYLAVDSPFSGVISCEDSASSAVASATNSDISDRSTTSSVSFGMAEFPFDVKSRSSLNDHVLSYWSIESQQQTKINRERNWADLAGNALLHGSGFTNDQIDKYTTSEAYFYNNDMIIPSSQFSIEGWAMLTTSLIGTEIDEILSLSVGGNDIHKLQVGVLGGAYRIEYLHNDVVEITGSFLGPGGPNHFGLVVDYPSVTLYNEGVYLGDTTLTTNSPCNAIRIGQSGNSVAHRVQQIALYDAPLTSGDISQRKFAPPSLVLEKGLEYPLRSVMQRDLHKPYSVGYNIYQPIQELVDKSYDLDSLSLIYSGVDGPGSVKFASYESGYPVELVLYVADDGSAVNEVGLNSGVRRHWDFQSDADRVGTTCLPSGYVDSYSINGSGFKKDRQTPLPLYTNGGWREFVASSSIAPAPLAIGFWASEIDHSDASVLSVSTPIFASSTHHRSMDFSLTNQSHNSGDFVVTMDKSVGFFHAPIESLTASGISKSQWNYFYFDFEDKIMGLSINGEEKTTVNTIINPPDHYGGLLLDTVNYKIDELTIWDHALDNSELVELYNHRFPWSFNEGSIKVQTLWPYEDVTYVDHFTNTVGTLSGDMTYVVDSQSTSARGFPAGGLEDDALWGNPYASGENTVTTPASGRFFSAINSWYSPHEISGVDSTFISQASERGNISFKTGPILVKPSSIDLQFWAKGTGPFDPGIFEASLGAPVLYDNSFPRRAIASGVSHNQGQTITHEFKKYESGLYLVDDFDSFDLTDTVIEFRLRSGTASSPAGVRTHFDLYALSLQVSGDINIAQTGLDLYTVGGTVVNSGIDLYTDAVGVENSGIDLYMMARDVLTSSIPMYAGGIDTDNSGMELYTFGALLHNSSIPLYMYGWDTNTSGSELYIEGMLTQNSGIDLYTQGITQGSGTIPFFMEATVSYGSGGFPLYMNSTANTTVYQARPMYISVNAEETDTGSIPFFLNSITAGSGNQYMPFFLESKTDSITKGTDMYLQNAFESGHKSQFLYVKGLGTLDGGAVDNGSMPLFIERIEGVENGMSMYLGVNSGNTQGTDMYTFGGTWSSSGVDLVIPSTIDTKNSGLNIFIGGF